MYRTILVPLDGSPFSESALPAARELARETGAALHLASVQEPVPATPGGPADVYANRLEAIARDWLIEYLREAGRRTEADHGMQVRTALLHGRAADALADYARERKIDLMVMTTHGQRGISRAWLGSVADRLARTATVPLLLLRPREEGDERVDTPAPFRRMLVPLDGSKLAESILPHALRLADVSGATLLLIRAVPPRFMVGSAYLPHTVQINHEHTELHREEAREYLEAVAAGLRSEHDRPVECEVIANAEAARSIMSAAAEQEADVIAIATHGRGGIRKAMLGSVADKVLRGTSLPLLLVRGSE